jgi:hypothetical protein
MYSSSYLLTSLKAEPLSKTEYTKESRQKQPKSDELAEKVQVIWDQCESKKI